MQTDTKIATVKATQMMIYKYTVKTASEEASTRFR